LQNYGVKIKKISHLASFKGEGVIPPALLQQATGQIFEYDVNVFSPTLDIFFLAIFCTWIYVYGGGEGYVIVEGIYAILVYFPLLRRLQLNWNNPF
jgi:hypothetical protein